jgi:hypothetical protein
MSKKTQETVFFLRLDIPPLEDIPDMKKEVPRPVVKHVETQPIGIVG